MRHVFAGLVLSVGLVTAAAAQESADPVTAHYRGYLAAFERGDLATAETEAEAALAASEARDHDGGSTAVLALNLANTRIAQEDAAGALAPAQRAFALSEGGAPNIDRAYAGLILGRAELATGNEAGATRLQTILTGADISRVPAEEVFPAAGQLARWGFAAQNYEVAEQASEVAARFSSGAEFGQWLGLGLAQTWRAMAMFMGDVGTTGRGRLDLARAREIDRLLGEANAALLPAAAAWAPDQPLRADMRALTEAMALRAALTSKLRSDNMSISNDDAIAYVELGPPIATEAPHCELRVRGDFRLRAPIRVRSETYAGVAVILRLASEANVVSSAVVARVGDVEFAQQFEEALQAFTVSRVGSNAETCAMPQAILTQIAFAYDPEQRPVPQ